MLQGVTAYSDEGASSGIAQNMQLKKRVDELKSVTMTTAGNSWGSLIHYRRERKISWYKLYTSA